MDHHRILLLVLALLGVGCERDNPVYCDELQGCLPGYECRLPARRCVRVVPPREGEGEGADAAPAEEPPDLAAGPVLGEEPDLAAPEADLRPPGAPDLRPPPDLAGCMYDHQCGPPGASGRYCHPTRRVCEACDVRDRCGATTCHVCAGGEDSAHPTCQAMPAGARKCVCTDRKDCDGSQACVMGTCYQQCALDAECALTMAGTHCVMGAPMPHCGCGSDADCPLAGTRCDVAVGICKCGGTLCRSGQRCDRGVCVR